MTLITIRERLGDTNANATLVFDGGQEFPITITDPFSKENEERLAWYFEEHLRFPFMNQLKAEHAAASVTDYGHALFAQIFSDPEAYAFYKQALNAGGISSLQFEINGRPEFHQPHWEALKDPKWARPFAIETTMVRRNITPTPMRAPVRESPTLNVLVVTARPMGRSDVGYRTIARPLVNAAESANVNVRMDFVRPGTYRALIDYLERARDTHGTGYYHVIHFDLHGALRSYQQLEHEIHADRVMFQARYGRDDFEEYLGLRAYLYFEGDSEEKPDPVEASELANLLQTHQVPVAILNACQSGKQVGDSETSLGSRLMQAGLQVVLAMGYSVTVSAAEILMRKLYADLFAGQGLANAIRRGRLELFNAKGRRAYFNQTIDLEDWLLPVVYQNSALQFKTRDFQPDEAKQYYGQQSEKFKFVQPAYEFQGRDLDILEIEHHLLQHNQLLVRGMGGAGKTTLLKHLGAWWQTTHWVQRVFYFGYDEKAYTRQQILYDIAQDLLSPTEFSTLFRPLGLDAQQALLVQRLRGQNHLLILDNLESITGAELAIQNTLPPTEQQALHRVLSDLVGGKTRVLLGSRGGEAWLAQGTFADNIYELGGLDSEAASTLADLILESQNATQYRDDPDLERLIQLLAGYPLPLQVVLENLGHQTPAEILKAFQAGDTPIDFSGDTADKTTSIIQCIAYSHSNLAPDAQQLLLCLAPFTSVVNIPGIKDYTDELRKLPLLAQLPFAKWEQLVQTAIEWGLMTPHNIPIYMLLQPTLPYFLRARLKAPELQEMKHEIEVAFQEYYDGIATLLVGWMKSNDPYDKQLGQTLSRLEYENLYKALELSLDSQRPAIAILIALSSYLDITHEENKGLELYNFVLAKLEKHSTESLDGMMGAQTIGVVATIAERYFRLKQYDRAEEAFHTALEMLSKIQGLTDNIKKRLQASQYHNLGMLAEEQRKFKEAEQYYQQALLLTIEINDREGQGKTYHQLGSLAEELEQWSDAMKYYQQSLQIDIELNNRQSQALTYHNLGGLSGKQQRWTQAVTYFEQAVQIFEEYKDFHGQAGSYFGLGNVAAENGLWERAIKYYNKSLKLYIELNDLFEQADIYNELGVIAQSQQEWTQAERYYRLALQIYREYGVRYKQASGYYNLALIFLAKSQWSQARDYFLSALEIFAEYQDREKLGRTIRHLALLWHTKNDSDLPLKVANMFGEPVEGIIDMLRQFIKNDLQ